MKRVKAEKLMSLDERGDTILLIDVRSEHNFQKKNIGGINVPGHKLETPSTRAKIAKRIREVAKPIKDKGGEVRVVVVCLFGRKTGRDAAKNLRKTLKEEIEVTTLQNGINPFLRQYKDHKFNAF